MLHNYGIMYLTMSLIFEGIRERKKKNKIVDLKNNYLTLIKRNFRNAKHFEGWNCFFLYNDRFSDISLKFLFSRQFYESGNVALFWRERTPRNREGGHVSSVEIQILSRTLACSDIIARVNSSPSFYDVWELRPLIFISTHQETKGEHSVILSRVWIPRHHFMMCEHWGSYSSRNQRWTPGDIITCVNSSPSFYDVGALRFRTDTGR